MTDMRRMWLDKVPPVVMIALWLASLLWAGWWTWQLWATADIYATGPGILLAVWLVPMLPLFLVTPFWLRRRERTGFWLLGTVLGVVILLLAIPYHVAIVRPTLYGFMTVLTLVPVGSIIAAVILIFRAGRSDARAEGSGV